MMKIIKHFVKYIEDGNLVLHELSPEEYDMVKHKSPCNKQNGYSRTYLLNATYEIRDGVLYLKGSEHTDTLIAFDGQYRYFDYITKKESRELREFMENYWIGSEYITPFKYNKFVWRKLRNVFKIDKDKVVITAQRYVPKKGTKYEITTSNFRIKEYETKEAKIQTS